MKKHDIHLSKAKRGQIVIHDLKEELHQNWAPFVRHLKIMNFILFFFFFLKNDKPPDRSKLAEIRKNGLKISVGRAVLELLNKMCKNVLIFKG